MYSYIYVYLHIHIRIYIYIYIHIYIYVWIAFMLHHGYWKHIEFVWICKFIVSKSKPFRSTVGHCRFFPGKSWKSCILQFLVYKASFRCDFVYTHQVIDLETRCAVFLCSKISCGWLLRFKRECRMRSDCCCPYLLTQRTWPPRLMSAPA